MDIITLAEYALFGGIGILALRELRVLVIQRMKGKMSLVKMDAEKQASFQGVSAIMQNSEAILKQLFDMRREQFNAMQKQNLAPQQIAQSLHGLDTRIAWIQRIESNKQWLQYVAPYADKIIETGLNMVNRWMKSV